MRQENELFSLNVGQEILGKQLEQDPITKKLLLEATPP